MERSNAGTALSAKKKDRKRNAVRRTGIIKKSKSTTTTTKRGRNAQSTATRRRQLSVQNRDDDSSDSDSSMDNLLADYRPLITFRNENAQSTISSFGSNGNGRGGNSAAMGNGREAQDSCQRVSFQYTRRMRTYAAMSTGGGRPGSLFHRAVFGTRQRQLAQEQAPSGQNIAAIPNGQEPNQRQNQAAAVPIEDHQQPVVRRQRQTARMSTGGKAPRPPERQTARMSTGGWRPPPVQRQTARKTTGGKAPRPPQRDPTPDQPPNELVPVISPPPPAPPVVRQAAAMDLPVITLSDSDDTDEIESSDETAPFVRTSTPARQALIQSDEEYARRLQRRFDEERESMLRRNREYADRQGLTTLGPQFGAARVLLQRLPQELVTSLSSSTTANSGSTDNSIDSVPNDSSSTTTASSTGQSQQPPNERTMALRGRLVAFHRRPGAAANVGPARGFAQNPRTVARELNALVTIMRERRAEIEVVAAEFGTLDAAILELVHAYNDALTQEEINALPTSVYSSDEAGTSAATNCSCTICMEEFVDGDMRRHLPCAHTFHKNCVDVWLKQKSTCPICRYRAKNR